MPLAGRYSFPGIKRLGVAGLKAALQSTPTLAWAAHLGPLTNAVLGLVVVWLTNKGLILLNTGAFYINGELDQSALDSAIAHGLKRVKEGGLSYEEIKAIDDAVIEAADRAIPYSADS